MEFSPASVLIIEHWETVQDILEALSGLEQEMGEFLHGLEGELKQTNWWSREWAVFQPKNSPGEVYISHSGWRVDGTQTIWVGVYQLRPENVFGSGDPPTLYVWVERKDQDLADMLVAEIEQMPGERFGELNREAKNREVVTRPLPKCPPGSPEGYLDTVREQIVEFLEHYASVLLELDDVIREQLAMSAEGE